MPILRRDTIRYASHDSLGDDRMYNMYIIYIYILPTDTGYPQRHCTYIYIILYTHTYIAIYTYKREFYTRAKQMFTNRITISRGPQTCVRLNKYMRWCTYNIYRIITYRVNAKTTEIRTRIESLYRTFAWPLCIYNILYSSSYLYIVYVYLLSDTSPPPKRD